MSRINSPSACDRGGSFALVDGGSVLPGFPGAPGCTTTGFAGSLCCARAVEQKEAAGVLAASSMPFSTADLLAEWSLRLNRKRSGLHFSVQLNIFIWIRKKACHWNTIIFKNCFQACI